ncbi:DJ-1_PfpI domain-containing protein [Trichoderma simmonsii]|uniref:DJ-1/PfpI family domain-containing protein n=3 Tax=Trichoderma TaxID=5543 RepID=A0A9W9E3V9_9HYPO|nr:DJ-1/PfpI family domain-containing protein [Trichoderma breve]KAF3073238.1 Isonitrile hydratase [Trichoderma lentiforme]KAJ4858063.1 DJ-1/PfpI family domain-containing protein [Trichoderma breve]QYT00178.1 DJ-1_PfpI domain-containing protein [Trichoderma simmonsii]
MAVTHVGILAYAFQIVDSAGPADLLSSANKSAFLAVKEYGPIDENIISRAPQFVFHYIGVTRDPVLLGSSQMVIMPTTTVEECPELDILLVPGPYLSRFELHPKHAEFIRKHVEADKMLWTTCTGASVVASTGVLDGKKATVNNVEYAWVRKRWPKVNWTREKKWIVDGNIWTGSGAFAGVDMVAHWLKENYGLDVLIQASNNLDYEARDDDGLYTVFPQRFDSQGNKVATHEFLYYDEE